MTKPKRTKPEFPRFKVEKYVPIPEKAMRGTLYPFPNMDEGDSFEFPSERLGAVTSASITYGKKNGVRFAIRKVSEAHHRVWRVK